MDGRKLTHLDDAGQARMVDVGGKTPGRRTARAEAHVRVGPRIAGLLAEGGGVAKGDAAGAARLAGIMAAKRTHELVPLCHPLALDHVSVDVALDGDSVVITATAACHAVTGVEMEAMTAVSVAALTIYDMCKSAGKGMVIENVRLIEKTGGRSGTWQADRKDDAP